VVPFALIDHLDTWALSSSLRAKRALFDHGVFMAYGEGKLHKTVREWRALAALINDVRHLPGANEREIGNIVLLELLPQSETAWAKNEMWARAQVAIVTNPLSFVFAGTVAQHLPIGALTLIDQTRPVACVNWGLQPVIYMIVWMRAKGAHDE
jgi:hypothetical protein